ncbi:hypothetical protein [Brevundimonas sp. TWP2-3-4b1]|uniref:hypothetical protein n=1 Tax=Brevundimonas sp. TWP2-3-4b1 TaxID=2804580 RepID=UPI003CEF8975
MLALMTTVAATTLAVVYSFPMSEFAAGFPLAVVSEAHAVAAAETSRPDLRRVDAETRRTLNSRPGDAAAWCRLAWVAAEEGRRADMLDALDRSYTVAPYGPDVTAWRLRFAYGRWTELTPELRQHASEELAVTVRTRTDLVNAAEADISDPAGRLAFVMGRRNATPRS